MKRTWSAIRLGLILIPGLVGITGNPVSGLQLGLGDPDFVVGADPASTEFFSRIGDAIQLDDGSYVVVDSRDLHLTFVTQSGEIASRVGRRGEGPGEFMSIAGIWARDDGTVAVWDPRQRRMSVLDQRLGGFIDSFSPESPTPGSVSGTPQLLIGGRADGRFVLGWLDFGLQEIQELRPDRIFFVEYSPEGTVLGMLGEDIGMLRARTDGFTGPHPFSPLPTSGSDGELLFFSNGLLAEFSVIDLGEQRLQRVETDHSPPTLEEAWRAAAPALDEYSGPMKQLYAQIDRLIGQVPAYGDMMVPFDDESVWLKRYDPSSDAIPFREAGIGTGEWEVVSRSGELLRVVQIPDNFTPLGLRSGRIFGTRFDEFGTPSFVGYSLDTSGAGES